MARPNKNRVLPSAAIEGIMHGLLDLKTNRAYGCTEYGRTYTVIRLVTLIEQMCRLVRRATPNPSGRDKKIAYQRSMLLDVLDKYDNWIVDRSHTHAQAIDKRPKIGDEILLTFDELQDLIKDTCRFHAVGVAEHVESTGHTYQSVDRVECAMTDFGVAGMFSSRCFGRRGEMDELFVLRHRIVHDMDTAGRDVSAHVNLAYDWFRYVLDGACLSKWYGTFRFHEGVYCLNVGLYRDAITNLERAVAAIGDDMDVVGMFHASNSYYNLALAYKHDGQRKKVEIVLDDMVKPMAASCSPIERGALSETNYMPAADRVMLVGSMGLLYRWVGRETDCVWCFDKALELCKGNVLAYLFLGSEFKKAKEEDYAAKCYANVTDPP